MILYKKNHTLCVLARIESMDEGKGRAEKKKMSVVLSYHIYTEGKERIITDRVDFWNASDIKKPQLADRIRREKIGQYIIAIISHKDADHTALAYMSKTGIFTFDKGTDNEKNIILGSPAAVQKYLSDGKPAYRIGLPYMYGNNEKGWFSVSFFDEDARKAFRYTENARKDRNLVAIVAGKSAKWTPKQGQGSAFRGYRIYEVRKTDTREKDKKTEEVLISIGPFKDNPIKAEDILVKSGNEYQKALNWMKYTAYEWNPPEGPEKESYMKQKNRIKAVLEEKTRAAS